MSFQHRWQGHESGKYQVTRTCAGTVYWDKGLIPLPNALTHPHAHMYSNTPPALHRTHKHFTVLLTDYFTRLLPGHKSLVGSLCSRIIVPATLKWKFGFAQYMYTTAVPATASPACSHVWKEAPRVDNVYLSGLSHAIMLAALRVLSYILCRLYIFRTECTGRRFEKRWKEKVVRCSRYKPKSLGV